MKILSKIHTALILTVFSIIGLTGRVLAAAEPEADSLRETRKIMAGDVLDVHLVDEPTWVVNKRVPEDGLINFPYIGDISVKGKTISDVERTVRAKLLDGYYVKPEVVANITSYVVQTISVLGKVARAGSVELPPDREIDVIEAIARAGDLTALAKKDKIELRRGNEVRLLRYDELKGATDPGKRIFVKAGDVIYVPEKFF